MEVIEHTRKGNQTTTFDEYANWTRRFSFGKEAVSKNYVRPGKCDKPIALLEADIITLKENIQQNIIDLIERNPQIEFYLFITPYSIYSWDYWNQTGILERQLETEKMVIEMLIEYDNIHLFSFFDEFDLICNLDNYSDYAHYGEWINSQILIWMRDGKHQLTKENYLEYCQKIYKFYTAFDYESLFI